MTANHVRSAPAAKITPTPLTRHGDTRTDNYHWLRDRSDPDVAAYLEAENAYTEAMLAPAAALQEALYREMLGRIQETDLSVPVKRDAYYYYSRTEQGRAYPVYCRKHGSLEADERVLLDVNELAAGHEYCTIGNFSVSPDHRFLAYSEDTSGDETYTILVKNLETGELLPDTILNTYYTLEWANDNRTFFYTALDDAKRPFQLWRRRLGEPESSLVYQEDDARYTLGIAKPLSREYLFLHLASPLTSEIRLLSASTPEGVFAPVLARRQGVEYDVAHQGAYLYIRTNENAPGFRLMRAPAENPSRGDWEEVLAARDGVTIESVEGFSEYLVVQERDRGLARIRVEHLPTREVHYIEFPEPAYSVAAAGNAEYDTRTLRFTYSSLVTPRSVFDYRMDTRGRELKKQQPVLGGYDPAGYVSERIFAAAPDGVQVPISLVYRRGTPLDGSAPLLLYGYGSYGISIDPSFSSDRLSLLDRGFVYAIAHIRGGADLGKPWHDAGKLLHKKNTFTDFIACAERLVAGRYTAPARLAITGGSAGGLLLGAALNLRPDLFAAALANVPFVDTLTTGLDPSLPLTVSEYEEWGNPEDREFYDYIKSYAPYDNVRAAAYPPMLVTAGLNDPRVSYWEPAKWVAKLRAIKTGDNLLLLKTSMGAGHFGASGRYERIRETAFEYSFLLLALGFVK